jgi:lipoprotein-anchoring transpeptidase ErfK/SrfK
MQMNNAFIESRKAIEQAREALRRGDRTSALKWGQEAARLAPHSEDPWLILAAVASPQASVDYIKKALEANPESPRARKGMLWAMQRLQAEPPAAAASKPATSADSPAPWAGKSRKTPRFVLPALIFVLGCGVLAVAAWSAVNNPALAAIWSAGGAQQSLATAQPQTWAQAELPKPTYTPAAVSYVQAFSTPTIPAILSTHTQVLEPSPTAGNTPTAEWTPTPEITSTPGLMEAAIVADTPTSEYTVPTLAPEQRPSIAAAVYGERWIDVDLSRQMVAAYEGDTLMNSFIVSTGTWQTPTVTGTYKIWIKLRSTTMTGPGYYLPNVPYAMYFYKGYGLHGTYWHNNFGTPMSHGCVNLTIADAEWLYNFASVGTTVNVHY